MTREAAALLAVTGALAPLGERISVIPKPARLETRPGAFVITEETVIGVDRQTRDTGAFLARFLEPATGFRLALREGSSLRDPSNSILLSTSKNARTGQEGYRLTVEPQRIRIEASTAAGAFYGCQTLRQLLPPEIESSTRVTGVEWRVPCAEVEDAPRFAWRGGLLDSGRHFWDKAFVKRFIDLLALNKLNRFHWHLTDDQGWRVQIDSFPKLTEIGAWRNQDGARYGGFYTREDLREIVAHAKSRHVTIIPEIEMPGHMRAALAAYPQFSCTGQAQPVATKWGVFEDILCPGNERTFDFVEKVLREVVERFPAAYVHVGGDECPRTRWKSCPKCQARIRNEGLKDEHALHGYFMRRVEEILRRKKRTLIAWDEVLEGGLPPHAVVQSWRGMGGGVTAAKAGHDVIMSPTSHCYLDYDYKTISIEQAYSFEPTFGDLTDEQKNRVLGFEGNMWTELTPSGPDVDRQVFPRLSALAEVGWSPKEARDWKDFSARLEGFNRRLDRLGVHYYRP